MQQQVHDFKKPALFIFETGSTPLLSVPSIFYRSLNPSFSEFIYQGLLLDNFYILVSSINSVPASTGFASAENVRVPVPSKKTPHWHVALSEVTLVELGVTSVYAPGKMKPSKQANPTIPMVDILRRVEYDPFLLILNN